jgi:hypothetical protein
VAGGCRQLAHSSDLLLCFSHSLSLLPLHHSLLQNSLPHRTEHQGALVGFAAVGFLLLAEPLPSKKKSLRPLLIIPRKYHWRVRGASTDCTFSWEPVLFRFLCYFPAFRFACAVNRNALMTLKINFPLPNFSLAIFTPCLWISLFLMAPSNAQRAVASQATQPTARLALRSKTQVTCLAFLPRLFSTGRNAESGPSISTTEKLGFSIVTTTGFPVLVSFAHQLEKSNFGAISSIQRGFEQPHKLKTTYKHKSHKIFKKLP